MTYYFYNNLIKYFYLLCLSRNYSKSLLNKFFVFAFIDKSNSIISVTYVTFSFTIQNDFITTNFKFSSSFSIWIEFSSRRKVGPFYVISQLQFRKWLKKSGWNWEITFRESFSLEKSSSVWFISEQRAGTTNNDESIKFVT